MLATVRLAPLRHRVVLGAMMVMTACTDGSVTAPVAPARADAVTLAAVPAPAAITEVVRPGAMAGWTVRVGGASAASFGEQALHIGGRSGVVFSVGTGHTDEVSLRTEQFAGTRLADLRTLRFSTYLTQRGEPDIGLGITLAIDLDADGLVDDHLTFRPRPTLATWQTWDALRGDWWSTSDVGSPDPRGMRSLAAYGAAMPQARLAGAIIVGAWDIGGTAALQGTVGAVVIGVGRTVRAFDFGGAAPRTALRQ